MAFCLLLYTVFLIGIKSASFSPGATLTLNTCGQYVDYQKWNMNNGALSLSAYSGHCLECSGSGYCGQGMKPQIASSCNGQYTQHFTFSNQNLQVNGLCLQSIGINEYGSIQILPCNMGYGNNILQQFNYDSNTGYIKSANASLCLTAMYYPIKNCSDSPFNEYDYCNQNLDVNKRVNDLVNRMNVFEKIDNLAASNIGVPRLGIPSNKVLECLHGIFTGCGETYNGNTGCPTSFPNGLLLGATFNRTLWNVIGQAISDEGRALNNQNIGGLYCFSPDINLFRYPTWGRGQEVPGEDPFLTSQYAIQYISGIQFGSTPDQQNQSKYLKMSNTVKHYADYDLEGCRYGVPCRTAFNGIVSQQDQVEYYWPAWRAAIQVSNAKSMMCSYNAINGVPACGNNYFMNEMARNEWNFDGFIISDSSAIVDDAFTVYVKQNANGKDDPLIRTKLALENGCDADLGDGFYASYMNNAYTTNTINITSINRAVSRWMKISFMLGQMDNPGPDYKYYGKEYVDSPQNRELAMNAAQQGIVLLKNKNNNTLPLKRDNNIKYGFIGPHFNITQYMLSSYRGANTLVNQHSPYQIGIKQGINIQYAQGCDVECNDKSGFNNAINIAKSVDTVIMFMGLYPIQYAMPNQNYSQALEAEDHDRENVTFPGYQLDLLQEIYNANTNIILVMINSAQIDLTWPKSNLPAIIAAFYPGELGGDALISILYGDVSPAGKLPYTLYDVSLVNNKPITDMSLSDKGGITYRYYTGTPVYPFGFGLSYTTFSFKYYNISENSIIKTSKFADFYRNKKYYYSDKQSQYIVQVTNTGSMNSDCVVLGFMTYSNANATSPRIKLFDFERVYVAIGQSVNVTLNITAESISFVNQYGQEIIAPGEYTLLMGDYQNNNYISKTITLIGQEEIIFDMNKPN